MSLVPSVDNPLGTNGHLVMIHAACMSLGFALFLPGALLIARYGKEHLTKWLRIHIALATAGSLSIGVGIATILLYSKDETMTDRFSVSGKYGAHPTIGVFIIIGLLVQIIFGVAIQVLRDESALQVSGVERFHGFLGKTVLLGGLFNIALGIQMLVRLGSSSTTVLVLYLIWVLCLFGGSVYLEKVIGATSRYEEGNIFMAHKTHGKDLFDMNPSERRKSAIASDPEAEKAEKRKKAFGLFIRSAAASDAPIERGPMSPIAPMSPIGIKSNWRGPPPPMKKIHVDTESTERLVDDESPSKPVPTLSRLGSMRKLNMAASGHVSSTGSSGSPDKPLDDESPSKSIPGLSRLGSMRKLNMAASGHGSGHASGPSSPVTSTAPGFPGEEKRASSSLLGNLTPRLDSKKQKAPRFGRSTSKKEGLSSATTSSPDDATVDISPPGTPK